MIIPTTTGGFSHLAKLMPMLSQEANAEIIVVDNASRDGTTNYLSNYDCLIKVNKTNLGFAKANNLAAKRAIGEYLLFLNNDTLINPGFIQEMVNTFSVSEKIGIVGCLILRMEEKKVQHAGVCFTQDYIPYELGGDIPSIAPEIPFNDPRVHAVRQVPAVTAACMMVKRECFLDVGGFDEEYINGWEDTDLVLKAREKDWKIWYTGKTFIRHLRFGSSTRLNHEAQNRARYDAIWVTTGRAKKIMGKNREM